MTTDHQKIPATTAVQELNIEVISCPRGPLLVRGADSVTLDGTRHPVERPVVAVCTCGKSSSRPWCDGTHKVIPHGN
jgi:hypothetical protein